MKKDANLSKCRKYRYALWRTWDDSKPYAMFIGLNPSTANETEDDPTIRRCISFSKNWGFGGLVMANLFAFRATKPSVMKASNDPIGEENNKWLRELANEASIVIAAWGNDGSYFKRSKQVKELLPNLHCFKINKSGEPAHPLYLSAKLKPVQMYI